MAKAEIITSGRYWPIKRPYVFRKYKASHKWLSRAQLDFVTGTGSSHPAAVTAQYTDAPYSADRLQFSIISSYFNRKRVIF